MTPSTQPKTKPSELAMKAAAEIIQMFPDGKAWQTPASISETIDRETNLPALLKQRDALKEALRQVEQGWPNRRISEDALRTVRKALALCDKE